MDETWKSILLARKVAWKNQFGLTRLAVFGSRARGNPRPNSDLDLLVSFQQPLRLDLLQFISLGQELEDELHVSVDMVMESDLKPGLRENVLREAVDL